jgi:hypothetical protein
MEAFRRQTPAQSLAIGQSRACSSSTAPAARVCMRLGDRHACEQHVGGAVRATVAEHDLRHELEPAWPTIDAI